MKGAQIEFENQANYMRSNNVIIVMHIRARELEKWREESKMGDNASKLNCSLTIFQVATI